MKTCGGVEEMLHPFLTSAKTKVNDHFMPQQFQPRWNDRRRLGVPEPSQDSVATWNIPVHASNQTVVIQAVASHLLLQLSQLMAKTLFQSQ
jgi:hypothetical protein